MLHNPAGRTSAWRWLSLSLQLAVTFLATEASFVRPAPAVTVGGAFRLRTPDGVTVTDQTFRGKWLLVYFGYTSCPDSCPTALFEIAAALRTLGAEAATVQPIFITIDPDRDTPKVVGQYVQSFDRRFVGLSGTQDEIDIAKKAYGAYAARRDKESGDKSYQFDHSSYIYLMSPQGRFVRGFDPSWSGDQIAATIRQVRTSSDRTSKIR